MENLKHTKDWTAVECTNGGRIVCLGSEKDFGVQRVQIADVANAKLIAAAPNLLKALIEAKSLIERCCALLKVDPNSFQDYIDIINAIKKATE